MKNQAKFNLVTLRAHQDDRRLAAIIRLCHGVAGNAGLGIRATHCALQYNLHVMDGGGTFRARLGRTRSQAARRHHAQGTTSCEGPTRSAPEIKDGYPEFTYGVLKSSAGTRPQAQELVVSSASAATIPDGISWRPTFPANPAGGDGARLHPLRHGKAAPMLGICPTRSRCIASDLHAAPRTGREYPTRPNATDSACPMSASTCRSGGGEGHRQAVPPHHHLRPLWSNTRAAARRRAPTSARRAPAGHVSSRSIRRMRPSAAIKDGAWSMSGGQRCPPASCVALKALVTERVARASPGVLPLRRLVPERRPALQVSQVPIRSCSARA